jgi:membrane-bound lytic murein transglycosylase B
MKRIAVFVCMMAAGLAAALPAPAREVISLDYRPKPRPVAEDQAPILVASSNARFDRWIKAFRKKAVSRGISGSVYDRAFRGVKYNSYVIEKDRNQSEFTKQIWDYLDTATSDMRVKNGKAAWRKHRRLLNQIEDRYGVDARVVLAIWGLESAYGNHMGDIHIIESLATLAFDGRRKSFFEAQLIAALSIIQSGDVTPNNMTGSWAGAMGHTQFIPTSYVAFAQDLRGDGRRDVWASDPADALASTANYLARHGWVKGQPWGMEVRLPARFDFSLAGERVKKSVDDWRKLGVTTIDGKVLPDYGTSSILLPAGSQGAAFIIFKNFHVIERYNTADAYVIGVGHLGDRIMGGDKIQAKWPRGDKALSFKQKKEMQRLLTRKGFDTEKVDGIIGPMTIAAIRAYQASLGMTPDGYASTDVLKLLKKRQ